MILNEKISIERLINEGNKCYPDRIKFCIDRKRQRVSIDEDIHVIMEHELYDDGSDYKDVFGGDILFGNGLFGMKVVWEAHPNVERNRELQIGYGREITDDAIKDELFDILKKWVY